MFKAPAAGGNQFRFFHSSPKKFKKTLPEPSMLEEAQDYHFDFVQYFHDAFTRKMRNYIDIAERGYWHKTRGEKFLDVLSTPAEKSHSKISVKTAGIGFSHKGALFEPFGKIFRAINSNRKLDRYEKARKATEVFGNHHQQISNFASALGDEISLYFQDELNRLPRGQHRNLARHWANLLFESAHKNRFVPEANPMKYFAAFKEAIMKDQSMKLLAAKNAQIISVATLTKQAAKRHENIAKEQQLSQRFSPKFAGQMAPQLTPKPMRQSAKPLELRAEERAGFKFRP